MSSHETDLVETLLDLRLEQGAIQVCRKKGPGGAAQTLEVVVPSPHGALLYRQRCKVAVIDSRKCRKLRRGR